MTVINEQTQFNFKIETYNGISVIIETNTGYFNASRMCSDNHKKWRNFKNTQYWKNKINAFKRSSFYRFSEDALIKASSFSAKINVNPTYQGEYIHPKLIHFVAEWCSDDYAFKVAELMDSINENVHNQLKINNSPDEPEQSTPIFNNTTNNIINVLNKPVDELENKQCWGIRESNKFDYLDSYDKDNIKRMFNEFKDKLQNQFNATFEELTKTYPGLLN